MILVGAGSRAPFVPEVEGSGAVPALEGMAHPNPRFVILGTQTLQGTQQPLCDFTLGLCREIPPFRGRHFAKVERLRRYGAAGIEGGLRLRFRPSLNIQGHGVRVGSQFGIVAHKHHAANVLAGRVGDESVGFPEVAVGGDKALLVAFGIAGNAEDGLAPLGRWREEGGADIRIGGKLVPDFLRVRKVVEVNLQQSRMLEQALSVADAERSGECDSGEFFLLRVVGVPVATDEQCPEFGYFIGPASVLDRVEDRPKFDGLRAGVPCVGEDRDFGFRQSGRQG